MKISLIFTLISIILWSCQANSEIVNSPLYQLEELRVYNQVLDGMLDTISVDINHLDKVKKVFYINDTLGSIGNKFLKIELDELKFSIPKATRESRHKFVRTGDSLNLDDKEVFTQEWLAISRVSLDESLSHGFLRLEQSCGGNLCGSGYWFEIEKIKGRWRIKNWQMMWAS